MVIMGISKYADFFHDGSIIDIEHKDDKIEILMSSAEVDEEDLKESIELSEDKRIKGKLYIEGVKSITIDGKLLQEPLKKEYNDGEIINFNIIGNIVRLAIQWDNYPPRPKMDVFSVFTIFGRKVYWENIPDLENGWSCPLE